MTYTYSCGSCGHSESQNRPVEERNDPAPCICGQTMLRHFRADLISSRIITWRRWCDCTRADLLPTYEDSARFEKSCEEFRKPEVTGRDTRPFQEAREQIARANA